MKRNFSILKLIGGVTVVLFALGIFGAIIEGETGDSNTTFVESLSKNNFELVNSTPVKDILGIYHIEGIVKNKTNKKFDYVQVQFNLYDKQGNIVGQALANMNNLDANGTWKFTAYNFSGESYSTYKLAEISGM